jgi:hypothetical protein
MPEWVGLIIWGGVHGIQQNYKGGTMWAYLGGGTGLETVMSIKQDIKDYFPPGPDRAIPKPTLINTRDTDAIIPPVYGLFRMGCNWVFAEESGGHNKYLNVVMTWAEGLCAGLVYAVDYKPVYQGEGKNDMRIRGSYSGTSTKKFEVRIDGELTGTGGVDTFKWSNDGGSSWEYTTVDVTGDWQTLENGIQIRFATTTGHTKPNRWSWMAGLGLWVGETLLGFFEAFTSSSGTLDLADHYFHNGSATQTVDAQLQAQCPFYNDANRRTCYSYIRLKSNIEAYPQGVQDFYAMGQWRWLYDPRDAAHTVNDETTWPYAAWQAAHNYALGERVRPTNVNGYLYEVTADAGSSAGTEPAWTTTPGTTVVDSGITWTCRGNNAALVSLDWVLRRFGMHRAAARIDMDSVEDLANWCDTNGMTFNGEINEEQSPEDTLRDIEMCYRGYHFERDGRLILKAFADDAAVMTLTEDDVLNEPDPIRQINPGIPETPDRVVAWYYEPLEGYSEKPVFYPDTAGLMNESALNEKEIRLVGITDRTKAKQLAKYHYLRAAVYNRTYEMPLHRRCSAMEPGDCFNITHRFFGTSAVKLRVVSPVVSQDNDWVRVVAIQENSALYDTTVNVEDEDTWLTPGIYTYPPDVSAGSMTGKSGGFKFSWTKIENIDLQGYIIYVNTSNDPDTAVVIARTSGKKTTETIDIGQASETGGITLSVGTPYYFWITALDENNHESLNRFYLGATTTPSMAGYTPVVSGIKKSKGLKVDWSTWTGFADDGEMAKLKEFEVYYSTSAACAIGSDAILSDVVSSKVKSTVILGLSPGTKGSPITYYVRVRPIGWSGNGTASEVA